MQATSSLGGTVLVGGGTGFIGSAHIRALMSKGYEYRIVSRRPSKSENHLSWTDIEKKGLPDSCIAVVNLAGQNMFDVSKRWTSSLKQDVWNSRVNTTRTLRNAIDRADVKPKAFIAINGVGYYKPSDTAEYTEDSFGGNFDFLSELSAAWQGETKLRSSPTVRRIVIRSGVVIGRQGGVVSQMYWPFFMGLGGPVGNGKQYFPWIHVDDMAQLIIFCIENSKVSGVLNGVAPQIITNKQFAQSLGKAMWRPSFLPMPNFMLNFIFSKERALIMTEGQRVIPKRTLEYGFNYKYNNIDNACKQCAH